MSDIDRLEELAMNATPGKWVVTEKYNEFEISTNTLSICEVLDFSEIDYHNAHYIAFADPSRILGLISRIREAERLLEYMHGVADSTDAYEHFSDEKLRDVRKWIVNEEQP